MLWAGWTGSMLTRNLDDDDTQAWCGTSPGETVH